jgi:hypothetical protein
MALQNITVPHIPGYDFGVGVDRLSGSAMNQVVQPAPSPPTQASGITHSFDVSQITSTADLQRKLDIDINASAGCALFGPSASDRFKFMQQSTVHSATLFMAITATVRAADLSIDHCVLTGPAGKFTGGQANFEAEYGNMFCRTCSRGGLFVGLMKIEVFDSQAMSDVANSLHGAYGFFSADAKTNFTSAVQRHSAAVSCSIYSEGGPNIEMHGTTDPLELLGNANKWMAAMQDPDHNAVPYKWTLSPVTIAEGPPQPNPIDIQNAQDILSQCARERTHLLDQLNTLEWYRDHADKYDWTSTQVTPDAVTKAAAATQTDLDVVARCASKAIDDPKSAQWPADFAAEQHPPVPYGATVPAPLPGPKPQPHIPVVSLRGLRATPIIRALKEPHTEYPQLVAEIQAQFEGTGFVPSREQFDFILSGVKFTYDPPLPGAATATGVYAWIKDQVPASGDVASGTEIALKLKFGTQPVPA